MAKARVDLRVDPELLEWADGYAKQRGVSRTELFEGALVGFREDCEAGVPEFKRAAVEQASRSGDTGATGVGDCPKRPGTLGHVFAAPSKDPERRCGYCGVKGRSAPGGEDEGFFAQATMARSDLFRNLRTPDSIALRKPK